MHKKVEENNFVWYNIDKSFVFERDVNMGKLLVKYDVRGIQAFVFRTNKLKEIRAVSDLPEKIISDTFNELNKRTDWMFGDEDFCFLDKAGGNALAVVKDEATYQKISTEMAAEILRKTYSLKLVYASVEVTDDFFNDYNKLNKELGKLKSEMPEACHIGAFPICRQDYLTGFPISCLDSDRYEKGKKTFLTQESKIKLDYFENNKKNRISCEEKNKFTAEELSKRVIAYDGISNDKVLDDLRGEDSRIAVIHIDGNNMGNRINKIIQTAKYDADGRYDNIKETFSSICVSDSFKEVCEEVLCVLKAYEPNLNEKPLIFSVVVAGDDITYVTRADIALPFTKLFLDRVSKKKMCSLDNKDSGVKDFKITACAGIAFIKSHFPFSDAYKLAERCCDSAKKRAKSLGDGNWVDFEICGHIKDIDLAERRKQYATVNDSNGTSYSLLMRPYCTSEGSKKNTDFYYGDFSKRISELSHEKNTEKKVNDKGKYTVYNRSRSKELRQSYYEGTDSVNIFNSAATSRGYEEKNLFYSINGRKFAAYYDAIEVMDLYDKKFAGFVSEEGKIEEIISEGMK